MLLARPVVGEPTPPASGRRSRPRSGLLPSPAATPGTVAGPIGRPRLLGSSMMRSPVAPGRGELAAMSLIPRWPYSGGSLLRGVGITICDASPRPWWCTLQPQHGQRGRQRQTYKRRIAVARGSGFRACLSTIPQPLLTSCLLAFLPPALPSSSMHFSSALALAALAAAAPSKRAGGAKYGMWHSPLFTPTYPSTKTRGSSGLTFEQLV